MSQAWAAGVDIGGTFVKAVAVTPDGRELDRVSASTPRTDRSALVDAVAGLLDDLSETAGTPPSARGLSAPGLAAPDGRSIAWMQGRMEAVEALDWTAALGVEEPLAVLNDAHAATLGEAWLGAAREARDAVLLTLGTGIGGGILLDGRLLRGHSGRAGHLGHLCLDIDGPSDICSMPGSLEEAVAECTIVARSGGRFRSTREVVAASQAGDLEAERIWLRSVRALACGIASIINAVDPEVVVLGGGIAEAGDELFVPLREVLAEVEWRPTGTAVPVVPAQLGDLAGAFGSARYALDASGGVVG